MTIALNELDTITDFIGYLEAKEQLSSRQQKVIILDGEEDLLAAYLQAGRRFPTADHLWIKEGLWSAFIEKAEVKRRSQAVKASRIWDKLIEYVATLVLQDKMRLGTLTDNETILRFMARESRLNRRMIGAGFREFVELAAQKKVISRLMPSPSGVTYVFFNASPEYDRDTRISLLGCHCFVARNEIPENTIVVGIGINTEIGPYGFTQEFILLSFPEWDSTHQKEAESLKADFGFFAEPGISVRNVHVDEYPKE